MDVAATNRYEDMNIPALRRLVADRGLNFGTARSKEELIKLLRANEAPRTTTIPTLPGTISPPRSPPVVTTRTQIPGAPKAVRQPTKPIGNVAPIPFNVPQVPSPTQARIPTSPTSPTVPKIPVVPITGTQTPTQVRVPVIPVVPIVPVGTTTQARVPVIPVGTTTQARVPTTQTRVPVIPVVPTTPPRVVGSPTKVPVIPQVTPTQTRVPVVPQVTPTQTRIPVIPQVSPPKQTDQPMILNQLDESIRQKLRGATFNVYDFTWKNRTGYPTRLDLTNGRRFLVFFNGYQRIAPDAGNIYVMEYLMTQVQPQFIAELVTELGFRRLNDTIDVYYNLLWYLNVAANPFAINLTDDEKQYISSLPSEQLLPLLGPTYRGPTDKASLLFAAVSGKSSPRPDIRDIPRYPDVSTYQPNIVWILAKDMYGLIDEENQLLSLYPPYIHVALQPPSVVERVIAAVNETNVVALLGQFGIVFPPRNPPATQRAKVEYFIREAARYDPVFTRGAIDPPPILTGKTKEQVRTTLAPYTLKEIVDAYEPTGNWTKRKELVDLVREEGRGGSQWSWRHRHCNNDDTLNIIEVEPHGKVNKDDPTDPTLSYGVQKNYRCYQISELEASWIEDPEDHIFHFRVPDWTSPSKERPAQIDPTTGAPLLRDFPIESIRQLRQLLQNPPPGYQLGNIMAKIDEGINAANNAAILVRRLKAEYDIMSEPAKYIVRLYLAWMFTFGMWMRFWNGPGHPWPTRWVEGGGGGDRCETGRRDEHVWIQQSIRTALSDAYEKEPGLKQWVENLPLIDYNFRTGEAAVATAGATNIKVILDRIQLGDFCMAHGSDLIIRTAYYLIARLLNLTTGKQFNDFINGMISGLIDIERQVVTYQLALIKDPNVSQAVRDRVAALRARQGELGVQGAPIPVQPPFDPTTVGVTHHTDPGLGWEIRFGEEGRRGINDTDGGGGFQLPTVGGFQLPTVGGNNF